MTVISNGPYVADWLRGSLLAGLKPQDAAGRRQADVENSIGLNSAIANRFANISQNQSFGTGNLAAKAAIARIRAATAAKFAEADKLAAQFKIPVKKDTKTVDKKV
jgi:hypothetical protein